MIVPGIEILLCIHLIFDYQGIQVGKTVPFIAIVRNRGAYDVDEIVNVIVILQAVTMRCVP